MSLSTRSDIAGSLTAPERKRIMAHFAFHYQSDHDIIAAEIEAALAGEATSAVVIPGPWTTNPAADSADSR